MQDLIALSGCVAALLGCLKLLSVAKPKPKPDNPKFADEMIAAAAIVRKLYPDVAAKLKAMSPEAQRGRNGVYIPMDELYREPKSRTARSYRHDEPLRIESAFTERHVRRDVFADEIGLSPRELEMSRLGVSAEKDWQIRRMIVRLLELIDMNESFAVLKPEVRDTPRLGFGAQTVRVTAVGVRR